MAENRRMNCAACGDSFEVDSHEGGKTFDYGLVYICGLECHRNYLLDQLSKENKFTVGDYTLEIRPGGRYWIRNKEGGGSEVGRESVEKMFKKLFEENFII